MPAARSWAWFAPATALLLVFGLAEQAVQNGALSSHDSNGLTVRALAHQGVAAMLTSAESYDCNAVPRTMLFWTNTSRNGAELRPSLAILALGTNRSLL